MYTVKVYFTVLLLSPLYIFAQQNSAAIDAIAGKLVQNMRENSKEKFLLTTDKNIYEQGETIHFNVFIVDSLSNKFTRQSKNLFVDLVNNNDSVITRLLLRGDKLEAEGSMDLKDSLLHGLYWLRAYTWKTINENIHNVAVYPVYILNSAYPEDAGVKIGGNQNKMVVTGKTIVDIFPEGGNIMSGTNSTVALYVHDAGGTPIMVSGEIRDNKNTAVAKFTTNAMGLAKFEFSPTWYGKYGVFLQTANGFDSVAVLPAVNLYGAQLAVTNQTNDNLHVRVMLEDSIYTKEYTSYLLCMHKDSLCFASIGQGMYELDIPVTDFPAGETDILLYNNKQELISSRSVYISKPKANIIINTDKKNYAARENVKMDIAVTDNTGKPIVAALTVSVKDNRIADTTNYFFKGDVQSASSSDMDLFMLTKKADDDKWRVTGNNKSSAGKNYLQDSFIVSGHLYNRKHDPVQNRQVTVFSKELSSIVYQDTTDATGSFSFALPDFEDSTQFYLQVTNMRGVKEEFNVEIDPFRFPQFKTPVQLKEPFYPGISQQSKEIKQYINNIIIGSGKGWLKPVTVTKNVAAANNIIYDGYIITKDKINGSANSIVNAILASGKFHLLNGFLVTGGPSKFGVTATDEPIIIVDGAQVGTSGSGVGESSPVISYLQSLQPEGIEYIKLRNESESGIYGLRGARGVIEIYSSHAGSTNNITTTGLAIINPQGYNTAKPLPSPDYNDKKTRNAKATDERTSLYWNGDLVTDNNGKATVNFFTADAAATYLVTITGVTNNGDKFFKTYSISRK